MRVDFEGSENDPGDHFPRRWAPKMGPEYISGKLVEWAEQQGVVIQHIQPGKPQQNAYIARYNRTVRYEWLDQHIIETIEEAQDYAMQWRWTYTNGPCA